MLVEGSFSCDYCYTIFKICEKNSVILKKKKKHPRNSDTLLMGLSIICTSVAENNSFQRNILNYKSGPQATFKKDDFRQSSSLSFSLFQPHNC